MIGRLRPVWMRNCPPDPKHPHGRRLTTAYRQRRRRVKTLWVGAGCVILINPVVPFAAMVILFATLSSFMILDEA